MKKVGNALQAIGGIKKPNETGATNLKKKKSQQGFAAALGRVGNVGRSMRRMMQQ